MARGAKPWVSMFGDSGLAGDWEELIVNYPNRFIFALDNVWGAKHWKKASYRKQMGYWRKALLRLPSPVAHAVAHGNAERLWGLLTGIE